MLITITAVLLPIGSSLFIVSVLIYLIVWRNFSKKVPHPPLFPILGNGLLFVNNTPTGILRLLKALLKKYGKRFQVALGTDLLLFTTDPKDFEVISHLV